MSLHDPGGPAPSLRFVALIPTFNNDQTILQVVERTLEEIPDVLVVDDGSVDGTREILEGFGNRIRVHRQARNLGKGRALRDGFSLLRKSGFTHAIALDSDGQHFPEDIPLLREVAGRAAGAIVVGEREMAAEGVPRRSRVGLWLSNSALRFLGGASLSDTQCGFRVYPLELVAGLSLSGNRFDLELEVLIRAARRRIPLHPVSIRTTYDPPEGRVTHFRTFHDFLQITGSVVRILSRKN